MRIDSLQQFVKLRRELIQERDQVSRRLAQINEALGEMPLPSEAPAQGVSRQSSGRAPQQRAAASGGAGGGGRSLRELVIEVLGEGAKTKEEVLSEVQSRGYKFQTSNPLNSLGVILYGKNPKFNRADGRFSLPGGAARSQGAAPAAKSSGGGGGGRQMSAAARARIAEAQRKRWAATRQGGGSGGSQGQGANGAKKAGGGAGKRTLSPAARKAIAEAARRRWAAAKASGKNRL
jgi:hypothetical protein